MSSFVNKILNNESKIDISIEGIKCKKCGKCVSTCPIVRFAGMESIDEEYSRYLCIECNSCVSICPEKAVTVSGIKKHNPVAKIPSGDEMLSLIKSRRSIRTFKPDPVGKKEIDSIIESVKYSPTGHNTQYIDLMFIQSPSILKKLTEIGMEMSKTMSERIFKFPFSLVYKKILGEQTYSVFSKSSLFYDKMKKSYDKGADPILFKAPCLLLFLGPAKEFMGKNDADLAAQTVALYAASIGLGSCFSGIIMSAFSGAYPKINEVIIVPDGMKVYNALMIGYPEHSHSSIPYRKDRNVYYK